MNIISVDIDKAVTAVENQSSVVSDKSNASMRSV